MSLIVLTLTVVSCLKAPSSSSPIGALSGEAFRRRKKNLRILSPGAMVKDQSKLGSVLGSQTSPLLSGQFGLRPFEQVEAQLAC